MKEEKELKNVVKERYGSIVKKEHTSSCCGTSSCNDTKSKNKVYNMMMEDYSKLEGYVESADFGLGCGLPTEFAKIQKGQTVIDLGSGAGNDCFVARHQVGEEGEVIGIDFTPEMIKKARKNAEALGFDNVTFLLGDIDDMPIKDQTADVVVSNCVLNLVPNKSKVIKEIYRVLKPGGHFSISDIVLVGQLPMSLRNDAEMYAGCIAGAIQKEEYLQLIRQTGFGNITIQKEKMIALPKNLLKKHLSSEEVKGFSSSDLGIFSITVYATKGFTSKCGGKNDTLNAVHNDQETENNLTEISKQPNCCSA